MVVNDGINKWFVDAILDFCINRRRYNLLQYLIQWEEGQEPIWEVWNFVIGADAALDAFHAQFPVKPSLHIDRRRTMQERSI